MPCMSFFAVCFVQHTHLIAVSFQDGDDNEEEEGGDDDDNAGDDVSVVIVRFLNFTVA